MATFTAGTSFTDGVTGDVTAAKLNALVANATPLSNFITDRTAETSIATDDLVLISDTSESGALNKMTVANLMKAEMTGTINSTAGTITTGVIPTLTSTTLITSGTGTASSPAIVPTGDTNTGIFFPAADTIAFSEGGTESMRIDSSGNVGIGTTSPAYNLDVRGSNNVYLAARATGSANNTTAFIRADTDGVVFGQTGTSATPIIFDQAGTERLRIDSNGKMLSNGASSTYGGTGSLSLNAPAGSAVDLELRVDNTLVGYLYNDSTNVQLANAQAGYLSMLTSNTERLRIDSSGNVGIGTTSPTNNIGWTTLSLNSSTNGGLLELQKNGTRTFLLFNPSGSSDTTIQAETSNNLRLGAGGTERLRIASGGEVYIAGTTDQGAYNLQVNGTGVWGAGAYVNGSDERLKENIQDITSGLDVVEKLRPVSFQYKEEYTADRSIQSGFIAQDLLVALEGKNYLEGVVSQGPTYYNVAYQNLIPILAKAIQELKAENDNLKARIEALETA